MAQSEIKSLPCSSAKAIQPPTAEAGCPITANFGSGDLPIKQSVVERHDPVLVQMGRLRVKPQSTIQCPEHCDHAHDGLFQNTFTDSQCVPYIQVVGELYSPTLKYCLFSYQPCQHYVASSASLNSPKSPITPGTRQTLCRPPDS